MLPGSGRNTRARGRIAGDGQLLRGLRCVVLSIAMLAGGCESGVRQPSPTQNPQGVAPISNTDACASRLHDFCGPLLLYYAAYHRLPERIEDLSTVPGFENMRDFACPVSGRPYIYDPAGTPKTFQQSLAILYDPAPSHSGMRWAISIIEPSDNAPLIAKVIALPEGRFAASRPFEPAPLSR